jgi:hypothetical protein
MTRREAGQRAIAVRWTRVRTQEHEMVCVALARVGQSEGPIPERAESRRIARNMRARRKRLPLILAVPVARSQE